MHLIGNKCFRGGKTKQNKTKQKNSEHVIADEWHVSYSIRAIDPNTSWNWISSSKPEGECVFCLLSWTKIPLKKL